MKELPIGQDAELLKAEFLKRVGRNIRMARIAANKSQRGLAFECEMEPASISRMESGRGNLTIATLLKIAVALHVTPATLVADQA